MCLGESCLGVPAASTTEMWGQLCWRYLHPTSSQTPGKPTVLVISHSLIRKWLQFRFRGSEVTLGKGRFSSGHDGICRACLEKPKNELRLRALALRTCIFCEHNTDNNTNLKNANLWAINSLLYPRQLLVFHIYL